MAGKLSPSANSPFQNLADVDPGQLALAVVVPSEKVTPAIVRQLKATVTTLREWAQLPGMDGTRVDEALDDPPVSGRTLGDSYVYTHHSPAGGLHAFNFVLLRTDEEMRSPIESLTYTTTDSMFWHEVINDLYFEESRLEFDEFIINEQRRLLPRVKPKADIIPGGNFPTKMLIEFFASHRPFPDDFYLLDPPVPSLVSWAVRNSSGSRVCLHPRMIFSDNITAGNVLPNCGADKAHQSGQPSIFPATNHVGWKNYVAYEQVARVQGVYFLERRTAFVPRGMKKLKGVGL